VTNPGDEITNPGDEVTNPGDEVVNPNPGVTEGHSQILQNIFDIHNSSEEG